MVKKCLRVFSMLGAFMLSATLSAAPRPSASPHGFRGHFAHARPMHFSHFGHSRFGGFRHGWGWRWGWGWGWWGWGWGPGWYAPYGYAYAPYGYGAYGGDWAVIDTDVSPEEARVYLDGRYIGIADNFDGYPDYLYLRPGNYRLEFRLEGYETKSVDLQARAGAKVDIGDKLKKIPGAKQYGSYDTPEPEGGVHRFWGKEKDKAAAIDIDTEGYGTGDWRGRGRGAVPREGSSADAAPPPPEPAEEPAAPPERAPSEPRRPVASSTVKSRIVFRIEPGDAAVYVDDRFAGTAEELSSLARGLQISSGTHKVVVSRPGFATQSAQVDVGAGKSETVEIVLERP